MEKQYRIIYRYFCSKHAGIYMIFKNFLKHLQKNCLSDLVNSKNVHQGYDLNKNVVWGRWNSDRAKHFLDQIDKESPGLR